VGLGLSAIRVKNKKEPKVPVRLHIGRSILEIDPNLKGTEPFLGQPFPTWSDVPKGLFKRTIGISDFTLFEHPKLVAELLENYSDYGFLPAIRAVAREYSPADKIPAGIRHFVWFPMVRKPYGVSYGYCHAVDPGLK
jgi:hypothetical protein